MLFALVVSAHTGGTRLGAHTYAYTCPGAGELAHLRTGGACDIELKWR